MTTNNAPLYLPADLPKISFSSEIIPDFNPEFFYEKMRSEKLTLEPPNLYEVTSWDEQKRQKYKMLMDWVEENIPIAKLINVKIVSPSHKINEHIDFSMPNKNIDLYKHSLELEPCGYRIVLRGQRKNNLFIRNRNGEKVFVELPDSTDTYLLSHTGTIHGLDNGNDDRYVVFIQAWMDKERHKKIYAESLRRYSDYAIY